MLRDVIPPFDVRNATLHQANIKEQLVVTLVRGNAAQTIGNDIRTQKRPKKHLAITPVHKNTTTSTSPLPQTKTKKTQQNKYTRTQVYSKITLQLQS